MPFKCEHVGRYNKFLSFEISEVKPRQSQGTPRVSSSANKKQGENTSTNSPGQDSEMQKENEKGEKSSSGQLRSEESNSKEGDMAQSPEAKSARNRGSSAKRKEGRNHT